MKPLSTLFFIYLSLMCLWGTLLLHWLFVFSLSKKYLDHSATCGYIIELREAATPSQIFSQTGFFRRFSLYTIVPSAPVMR
jgi:hypothetical protein